MLKIRPKLLKFWIFIQVLTLNLSGASICDLFDKLLLCLKTRLNVSIGIRALLNLGRLAGRLPPRSLSQCFKVGDCAAIILYCPFYAKVSLSFYIPLKSKAILEHLILFNLFTLAA